MRNRKKKFLSVVPEAASEFLISFSSPPLVNYRLCFPAICGYSPICVSVFGFQNNFQNHKRLSESILGVKSPL
jgi:hypothetical protein